MTVEKTTDELTPEVNRKKNYTTLWLMILLFGLPYIAAFYFYFYADKDMLGEQTNYGTIITPVRQLNDINLLKLDNSAFNFSQLKGNWVFVSIGSTNCQKNCQDNLYKMRQIRKAVGKDQFRVQRVFLLTDTNDLDSFNDLLVDYPGMEIIIPSNKEYQQFISDFSVSGESTENGIFIIDPMGNYMMAYTEGAEAKGILKDIERLLKLSQTGNLL